MRRLLGILSCALAVALAGCAGLGAAAGSPTPTPASRVTRAQATHEYSSAQPPRQHAAALSGDGAPGAGAVALVRAFALAYINWSAPTLSADLHALAAASIGQARSAMQLGAANAAQDYELKRGGIANSGTVEAVAPLAGSRERYLVVTRERTTASATTAYQGLRPAWHITLATVAELAPGQWVLSGWQPES